MIRRLFALLILVGLVVFGAYYWKKYRPSLSTPKAPDLGGVSEKIREGMGDVGQRLRDTKTTGAVKAALELNRTVQPYSINVDTENGIVTLRGDVPREAVRSEAEKVAAAVPDVRQVVNQLRVDPAASPPAKGDRTLGENLDDQKLEMQARLAFSLNRELKGTDIDVKSHRRQLTLSGRVATAEQHRVAVQIAQGLPDTANVVDQIQVGGAAAPNASPAASGASAAAVERALAANPNLAPYRIQVRDEAGKLVLSGRVKTGAEKELAGMLARDSAGAPIENAIEVRPDTL